MTLSNLGLCPRDGESLRLLPQNANENFRQSREKQPQFVFPLTFFIMCVSVRVHWGEFVCSLSTFCLCLNPFRIHGSKMTRTTIFVYSAAQIGTQTKTKYHFFLMMVSL